MSASMSGRRGAWALTLVAISLIFMAGGAMALWEDTLVSPWVVPAVALVPSAALLRPGVWLWKRLAGVGSAVAAAALHMVAGVIVWSFVILGVNRLGADPAAGTPQQAEVVSVYTRHHHSYGRRHRRDREYDSYHARIRLADGRERERRLTAGSYARLRPGMRLPVTVSRGALGMAVIHMDRR